MQDIESAMDDPILEGKETVKMLIESQNYADREDGLGFEAAGDLGTGPAIVIEEEEEEYEDIFVKKEKKTLFDEFYQ